MKFLIVGLGSMGKRRVRNLQYLKAGEIIGFDPRADRRAEAAEKYDIATVDNLDKGLALNPDALVISTPPDLHAQFALKAAQAGKHFFTEAGVVTEGMEDLIELCESKPSLVAAPSCTMRFQPAIKKIRSLVKGGSLGTAATFTYQSGQYLPDWHPWEDYRKFYVAKRETGACREIVPFELVWLTWVFGPIKSVSCKKAKRSNLEVDIDDVYHLLLEFEDGTLGHLLVDVVSRVAYRTCKILTQEGVILMDWVGKDRDLKVYSAATQQWESHAEDKGNREAGYLHTEEPYIEEMKAFVEAIKGTSPYPYSLQEDFQILKWLQAAEKDSEKAPAAV